jgi:hypothetical protein
MAPATTRRVTCGERRRAWLPPLGDVVPLETLALQAGGDGVVPTGQCPPSSNGGPHYWKGH